MPSDNQVSAVLTDAIVAEILQHLTAIEALLPFLISREEGDTSVMLGEKSVGFDEKTANYMAAHPEFLPGYIILTEVLKDRALREQLNKILPVLKLLAKKVQNTYDVVGNELMIANLAYYSSTDDAAKRGVASAKNIHDDLATRFPGRSGGKAKAATAK